ncbi:MAG: hypothetical protein AABZ64_12875 [Nitrospinota bacterium]|mgnify:CR=1 FL=1
MRGPEPMEPRDFASRWEDAIHGRSAPGEVEALRRELSQAGRLAEFEAQAEAASAVRGLASRHPAPLALRRRLAAMSGRRAARNLWWGALGGALAASLVMAAGLQVMRGREARQGEAIAGLAQDARAEFVRAGLEREPSQSPARELARLQRWFEPRVNFSPKVFFPGDQETTLEGARVGIAEGVKIASYLYKWRGKPLVLVIFPAGGNPAWAATPERQWTATRQGGLTVCVWRRGKYIYSLVGDASPEKMRELSRSITPPDEKFDS